MTEAPHTLCSYVFDAVYIDRLGDVYSCAHQFPTASPYGNIRTQHLDEILRESAELASVQAASRQGTLACFARCNLLPYDEKHGPAAARVDAMLPGRIRKLKLTIGWLCNAACVMCPQDHRERTQLDLESLRDRIDWTRVDEIIIEGGEPFAIPLTFELWDHLRSLGKQVNFLSNALLITPTIADRLAETSDYLYVSVNAATDATYRTVMAVDRWRALGDRLALVREARARRSSPLRLIAHFTIVADNVDEVAQFIPWAEAQGFDIVNFGYNRMPSMGPVIPTLLESSFARAEKLRSDLDAAITAARGAGRLHVDVSRLLYLGLLPAGAQRVSLPVLPSGN